MHVLSWHARNCSVSLPVVPCIAWRETQTEASVAITQSPPFSISCPNEKALEPLIHSRHNTDEYFFRKKHISSLKKKTPIRYREKNKSWWSLENGWWWFKTGHKLRSPAERLHLNLYTFTLDPRLFGTETNSFPLVVHHHLCFFAWRYIVYWSAMVCTRTSDELNMWMCWLGLRLG